MHRFPAQKSGRLHWTPGFEGFRFVPLSAVLLPIVQGAYLSDIRQLPCTSLSRLPSLSKFFSGLHLDLRCVYDRCGQFSWKSWLETLTHPRTLQWETELGQESSSTILGIDQELLKGSLHLPGSREESWGILKLSVLVWISQLLQFMFMIERQDHLWCFWLPWFMKYIMEAPTCTLSQLHMSEHTHACWHMYTCSDLTRHNSSNSRFTYLYSINSYGTFLLPEMILNSKVNKWI